MLTRFRRHLGNKEGEGKVLVQAVTPLRQALALTTRLPKHFVVRSSDGRSTDFFKQMEGIQSAMEVDDHLIDVPSVCEEIDRCVQQFAVAQTQQIDETIGKFTAALEELVDGLDKSVVDQGVRLVEIQKIKTGLGQVDGTSTLEETMEILSAGIAGVSKLVDRELEIQRELRKVHDQYKGRFLEDLTRAKSESSIDPITKIANRNGIAKHFKAACDHTRTNGSNYTLALVNLEGCSVLHEMIGKVAADNALAAFAQRLQAAVGGSFIGRFGEEDFVVITSTDSTMLSRLLSRLAERLTAHPVGGVNTNPLIPCFAVCRIEPGSVLERLIADLQPDLEQQRSFSRAA